MNGSTPSTTLLRQGLSLFFFLILPGLLRAQDDTASAPEPASAEEIAFWRDLQAEISAFRSSNSSFPRNIYADGTLVPINDAMDRVEDFLDTIDEMDTEDLPEAYQQYQENLINMLEACLAPLQEAANFHDSETFLNPLARMTAGAKANNLWSGVNDYKYPLRSLHQEISERIIAGGGPRIFFFHNLNLLDSEFTTDETMSPAERDERFIAESAAIDPGLGVIADLHFVSLRRDGRSDSDINAIRTKMLEIIGEMGDEVKNFSTAEIQNHLAGLPADGDELFLARIGFAMRQELLRRERETAAAFRLADWQAAYARWQGEVDGSAYDAKNCRDLAVTFDGALYAYSLDNRTVTVRSNADHSVHSTHAFESDVRGLAFDHLSRLLVSTTGGLFRWDVVDGGEPYNRNETTSPNVTGRLAAALERDRFATGWANIPAFTRGSEDANLTAHGASNITAVAMARNGLSAAYGFSSEDNLGNGKKIKDGIVVITLPEADDDNNGLMAVHYTQSYRGPISSIAYDDDASHIAFAVQTGEVLVYPLGDEEKPRSQLTIDQQPYRYVSFLPGEAPRLLAAANNGVVRIWDYETNELLQRFEVPTGPSGVAFGVSGDNLLTVALGAEAIHQWSLAEGSHLTAIAGPVPDIDDDALAAALAAEQELAPTVQELRTFTRLEGEEKVAFGRELIAEHGAQLDLLGRRHSVAYFIARSLRDQIRQMHREDKDLAAAAALVDQAIADGFVNTGIYYQGVTINLDLKNRAKADQLLDDALQLYPSDSDFHYLYHWNAMIRARYAGDLDGTLAAIDEIDLLRPKDRPHNGLRLDAHTHIGYAHLQAGRKEAGLELYLKAFDLCRTKEDQMNILPNLFSVACELERWQLIVGVANVWLEIDPDKKNDANFMEWARYAYSQLNN